MSATRVSRDRIYAIDFMRLFVVIAVITNHVISYVSSSPLVGGVWTITHIGREMFLMISAFVLVYAYSHRTNMNWRAFYLRRYTLVGVPYLTWTIIYALAYDHISIAPRVFIPTVAGYLVTGQACYHLYFMVLLLQFYLIVPLVFYLLRKTQRYHLWLVIGAALLQAVLNFTIEWSLTPHGLLGLFTTAPDSFLTNYIFYIIAGSVTAWHAPQVVAFADKHLRLLAGLGVLTAVIGLVWYAVNLHLGVSVVAASTTFQPAVIFQSAIGALLLLALGRAWERSGMPAKWLVEQGAVVSFGIYLAHPLVIQLFLNFLQTTGGLALYGALAPWQALCFAIVIGIPVVLFVTVIPVYLLRRTPLALPLIGRLQSTASTR